MLDTVTYNPKVMADIIAILNKGELINAIKAFRIAYGVGLREAKDAVEAIRDAIGSNARMVPAAAAYILTYRWAAGDPYERCFDNEYEALREADALCRDGAEDVTVSRIVSKAVTTSAMKRI